MLNHFVAAIRPLCVAFLARLDFDVPLLPVAPQRLGADLDVAGRPFRVVVYPKGRTTKAAAAYLEPLDDRSSSVCFALRLVADGATVRTFENNGGAVPGNGDVWVGAMTLSRNADESEGRATDWGAHAWPAQDTDDLRIAGYIEVFEAPASRLFRGGRVLVPVARNDRGRQSLESRGLRSGGEYRIMGLEGFASDDPASITVRPAYRNLGRWPVDLPVDRRDVTWLPRRDPRALGPRFFNEALDAAGGKVWRAGLIFLFWIASALAPIPLVLASETFFGLYAIPSESMAPTLRSGDLLVVDKFGFNGPSNLDVGDIVVFKAPPALDAVVRDAGVPAHSTFVKRLAAKPGQPVVASSSSRKSQEDPPSWCTDPPAPALARAIAANTVATVPERAFWVLGDCATVSVDSRVWGPLPASNVVGTPRFRLWPPSRFGPFDRAGPIVSS